MNNLSLKNQLATVLNTYQSPLVRYQNLAFSSKNFLTLEQISIVLQELLPDYHFWNGNQPELNQAPISPCYRKQFIEQVFDQTHPGLIIQEPHYWLQHWTLLDKQAFWSALSTRHGSHQVIVIVSEGHEFATINQHYVIPQPLDTQDVTVWVSAKTSLA